MEAEGSIEASKPGYLVITVTARLNDSRIVTIAVYNVNVEPLPRETAAMGMVVAQLIVNHTKTLGYISGQP